MFLGSVLEYSWIAALFDKKMGQINLGQLIRRKLSEIEENIENSEMLT